MQRIRQGAAILLAGWLLLAGCRKSAASGDDGYDGIPLPKAGPGTAAPPTARPADVSSAAEKLRGEALGFDRNDYPGDASMAALHTTFGFTGYWLTPPPGEMANSWAGKRAVLRAQGWGFLLLANGKLDKEILAAQRSGSTPTKLGEQDAAAVVASARSEGFPKDAILFLDQEEGGRLLAEQAAYLLGWTEAVARSGFRPGVYASGQPVSDEPGTTIDTIEDIRSHVKTGRLHEVAIFDAEDACPPAPGCTLAAKPLHTAGEPDLIAWQYAQSPRRPEITRSCAATYAADGNCYVPSAPGLFLDMDLARSADPSHGR